jgi:hypothetical protein
MPPSQKVMLAGGTLPAIRDMEQSGRTPEARLSALTGAGARIVRLPVMLDELTPTFVPAKVVPLARQAQSQGAVLVLSFFGDPAHPDQMQADDAEDFISLMLTYLKNSPNIWLEPINAPLPSYDIARRRSIDQRMLDLMRGNKAANVMVVHNPRWMIEAPAAFQRPLIGDGVVYSADASLDAAKLPLSAVPFLSVDANVPAGDQLPWAGVVLTSTADAAVAAAYWQRAGQGVALNTCAR